MVARTALWLVAIAGGLEAATESLPAAIVACGFLLSAVWIEWSYRKLPNA